MFAKIHFSDAKRILKPLIALALSYAMAVNGFASHQFAFASEGTAHNEICIATTKSNVADSNFPDSKRSKSDAPQGHDLKCCLAFSSNDLPRVFVLFSVVAFAHQNAIYPPPGFSDLIFNRDVSTPVLPRAPPQPA